MHVENSNSQNDNYTITSCQRGTSQGSYRIFMGSGSSFFLSVDFFIQKKIMKGLVVDPTLLEEIKEESLFVEAYVKAISLLSRQGYSRHNLKRKLLSKDFDLIGIERALDYLENQGYLNDKNYAVKWVESRLRNKLDSYNILLSGLIKKGIEQNIAKDVLQLLYTDDVNASIIRRSVEKFIKQNKSPDAIIKTMVRKGFNRCKIMMTIDEFQKDQIKYNGDIK